MSDVLKVEHRDDVAVLTMDRPPGNALSPGLRADLMQAFDTLSDDAGTDAIVLCGAGPGFSSGVEITEYDGPAGLPGLGDLCTRIENCPKPVVAALHGTAMGGGLELALACHARIAAPGTRIGLPDIRLGLPPGSGATQRLPRLTGAQTALQLMLSGQPADAADRRLSRVFRTAEGDPVGAACRMAKHMASDGWQRVRDRDGGFSDPMGYQAAIATARGQIADEASPEMDVLRCVEAAQLLPFDRGIEFERSVFLDRVATPAARARRHLFAAEKRAALMPEASGAAAPVETVALLGGGDLMVELCLALMERDVNVRLAAPDAAQGQAIANRVGTIYDQAAAQGQVDAGQRTAHLARLETTGATAAVAQADLVLDAAISALPDPPPGLKPNAVWAVLSEGGKISDRVARADAGARAAGLKLHRPAHATSLVEIAVPDGADPGAIATLARFANRIGRAAVRCRARPGLASGNLEAALLAAGLALHRQGNGVTAIDEAARICGFDLGPFQRADITGIQTGFDRYAGLLDARGLLPPAQDSLLRERLGAGAAGRRAGRGFYLYDSGKPTGPDPELPMHPPPDTALPANSLPATLLAAVVNEAARLLATRMVQRASDLDLVLVRGLGYDKNRGGPLLQADLGGLLAILKTLRKLSAFAPIWQPQPLIEEMVKNGTGFYGRPE